MENFNSEAEAEKYNFDMMSAKEDAKKERETVVEHITEYKEQTIVIKNCKGSRTFHLGNIVFDSMKNAKMFIDDFKR